VPVDLEGPDIPIEGRFPDPWAEGKAEWEFASEKEEAKCRSVGETDWVSSEEKDCSSDSSVWSGVKLVPDLAEDLTAAQGTAWDLEEGEAKEPRVQAEFSDRKPGGRKIVA
jgi:hypothetical protein